VSDENEEAAQRIAKFGRDALVARLRPAFEQAAAAHADVLELSSEQLEQMVQQAADRADGLQWRRALAAVATGELGVGLAEALSHPAVARAQEIVGAPSYEESLAQLGMRPRSRPEDDDEAAAAAEQPAGPEEVVASDEEELPAPEDEDLEVALEEPGPVRLAAVHLGGIANLEPGDVELQLLFSEVGLDIVKGQEEEPLGRLTWREIDTLQVAERGRWRRRRANASQLVVRTPNGDASFQIPAVTSDELNELIRPLHGFMKRD